MSDPRDTLARQGGGSAAYLNAEGTDFSPLVCGATMRSTDTAGHIHTCTTEHETWEHMCSVSTCRRWFFQGDV